MGKAKLFGVLFFLPLLVIIYLSACGGGSGTSTTTQTSGITPPPNQEYMYVTNYNVGTLSVYQLQQTSGALQPVPISVSGFLNPSSIVASNDGKYIYLMNEHIKRLESFTKNPVTGDLSPLEKIDLAASGTLKLSADGKYLYASTYTPGVSGFAVDSATGKLTPLQGSPYSGLSVGPIGGVHPNGKYMYAIGTDGVTALKIGSDGVPSQINTLGGFGIMRDIVVDSSGKFAIVLTYDAQTLEVLSIDPISGAVARTGLSYPVQQGSFALLSTSQRVYVTTPTHVLGFAVDSSTGTLSALPGSPYGGSAFGNSRMQLSSNGKYFYVTGGTSDFATAAVFCYTVATDGSLTHIAGTNTFAAGNGGIDFTIAKP